MGTGPDIPRVFKTGKQCIAIILPVCRHAVCSQDEANLQADFPSMGTGLDIPRVLKTGSRVRNKNITKRQTEMLVKEIWKVRMAHRKAGKAGIELVEMIFLHLQKTKGLHQAVIEVSNWA